MRSCIAVLLAVAGCGGGTSAPPSSHQAALTYAQIVHASYADALARARALDSAARALAAQPSLATLRLARDAWLAAREPYLETEVYRFYDGPIDDPAGGVEGLVNAWPLDEGYIDYVDGKPNAGIINDSAVSIDAGRLMMMNEQGGEANIATGYHAIEFLLWGQDRSASGPGERPFTDYLTSGGSAANQGRRGQYLTTASALLVTHLEAVTAAWAPGADNYRRGFEAAAPAEALRRILTGMIILSGFETGGERLQTALDSGDQEDEHSCFSDNTHRDMIQDIQGMTNVWQGSYTRLDGSVVSGTGLRQVVSELDATLAGKLDAQLATSLMLARALVPPFDREIASSNGAGRARVAALVVSLRAQAKLFEDVFRALGLDVPVPA